MQLLQKAISSDPLYGTAVREFIHEDLEPEAHNQLWNESDPEEMVLLKMVPRISAAQTRHEFTKFMDYGNLHSESAFAPNGLPSVQDFTGDREEIRLRPYGEVTQVQGLAAAEKSIRAIGKDNVADVAEESTRRLLMYKINLALYSSDTRDTLNESRIKGFLQGIDEGTRASGATDPDSNIIIDLRGGNVAIDGANGVRKKSAQISKLHGSLRWLLMGPDQNVAIEEQLDNKSRYYIAPQGSTDKMIIGARVDGIKTASGVTLFQTDNALEKNIRVGEANNKLIDNAPAAFSEAVSGAGTFKVERVASGALPGGIVSKFEAIDTKDNAGAGSVQLKLVYHVVACNEVGDSIRGVSTPLATVVVGDVAKLTIAPRGGETSFKIYRGIANVSGIPANDSEYLFLPEFIAEIPNGAIKTNTTPIEFFDENDVLPGTSHAFGLNMIGDSSVSMSKGAIPTSLINNPKAQNALSMVQLTSMFRFDLAKLGWLAKYGLLAWVIGAEVTKPFQNIVYRNCGRKQIG